MVAFCATFCLSQFFYIFTSINSFKVRFIAAILMLVMWFDVDILDFKLSFDVDFLSKLGLATVLATFFQKLGKFFSHFLVTLLRTHKNEFK